MKRELRVMMGFGALAMTSLGMGCTPLEGTEASRAQARADNREHLLKCWADDYRQYRGKEPVVDGHERDAADKLLENHKGNPKEACQVVRTALAGNECGQPMTIGAINTCEERGGKPIGTPGLDRATTADMQQRVDNGERNQMNPMDGNAQ